MSGVSIEELLRIAAELPEVESRSGQTWTTMKVAGKGFGWVSEEDESVALRCTLDEQVALAAIDPQTFSTSYTSDNTAWLRVRLSTVDRDELVELVTEAWRLTAPRRLVQAQEPAD